MRLLLLTLILASCVPTNRSREFDSDPKERHAVFKADPLELLENTEKNLDLPLTDGNFSSWDDYVLVGKTVFSSHGADDDNVTPYNWLAPNLGKYFFRFTATGGLRYQGAANGPALDFTKQRGQYRLSAMELDGKYHVTTLHHFSANPTKEAFSLLFSFETSNRRELWSLVFAKNTGPTYPAQNNFSYLLGRGLRSRWLEKPVLHICHSQEFSPERVAKFIRAWGSDTLEIKSKTAFPPFSDLNNNCLYLNSNYRRDLSGLGVNTGTTFPVFATDEQSFFDMDIFIWLAEFKKYNLSAQRKNQLLDRTITHEIGHFLGLGHVNNYPSVMAPKLDDPNARTIPSTEDIRALENLYQ